MTMQDMVIDQKIETLRKSDPPTAAAYALRYRAVCPQCGGHAPATAEDARTSLRQFGCRSCGWSCQVTEAQFRSDPKHGLRRECERAASIRDARTAAMKALNRGRQIQSQPVARHSNAAVKGEKPAPVSTDDK